MMLGVISAEAMKLTGHRMSWGLVWIYPLGLLLVSAIMLSAAWSGDASPQSGQTLAKWLEGATGFWGLPRNGTVRILIAGFIAVAFAGEYGWNTWKLVVPHRRRWMLIAAKYVVTTLLLLVSLTIAAWIFTGTTWLEQRLSGDQIPAGISVGGLVAAQTAGMLTLLAPLLLTIAYASLAAIVTRSMIGALVVSIVLIVAEQAVANFGPLLARFFPDIMLFLYNILPGYHLSNLTNWILAGVPDEVTFPSGAVVAAPIGVSLAVVSAWIAGLVALTFWRFQRQDIN